MGMSRVVLGPKRSSWLCFSSKQKGEAGSCFGVDGFCSSSKASLTSLSLSE